MWRHKVCKITAVEILQRDAEFAGNTIRIVIIDRVNNTLLGRLILDPAGMHCPSWDDAFVSS